MHSAHERALTLGTVHNACAREFPLIPISAAEAIVIGEFMIRIVRFNDRRSVSVCGERNT